MSNKHEHHGMSRAAELLDGIGTTREIAATLGKSAGTIGDYRTGRRRPSPDVIAAIEARWPQIAAELWDAPARAQHGPQTASAPRVAPRPYVELDDEELAPEDLDASAEANAAELHEMIQSDLARLRGREGVNLELGKRSEIIRRLVAASSALTKTTSQSSLTVPQILASSGGRELIDALADALASIPTARWALEHAARALAGDLDEAGRALLRLQIGASYHGDLSRRASVACPDCSRHREFERLRRMHDAGS